MSDLPKTGSTRDRSNASFAPFCSRRCKEVDLVRWCEGRYAIVEEIDPTKLQEIPEESFESEDDPD